MTTKHDQTTQNTRRGFTLIELTIVITIIGLFIGAITSGLKAVVIKQQSMQTKTRMENIREALIDYVEINGRLPCPADPTIPIGIAGFGREAGTDCAAVLPGTIPQIDGRIDPITTLPRKIRVGAVPVLALGLSFETMLDGSKNYFTYAVTEALTATPTFSLTEGAIEIIDLTGASMLSVPETALYTVFSHGRDGRGSYTASGVLNGAACDSVPGLDAENCDGDGVFRSAVLSRTEGGDQFYDDSIEFSETILDTDSVGATVSACPPGIAGIPGVDEDGFPTCFPPPSGGHFFEVCGLSVIYNDGGQLANISPCNGTYINSITNSGCPDGFAIIMSSPDFAVDRSLISVAKFYTCVPLGLDGYRNYGNNTFIPNGATSSCTAQISPRQIYTGTAWVEDGKNWVHIIGRYLTKGGQPSGVFCRSSKARSRAICWSGSGKGVATFHADGVRVYTRLNSGLLCTGEWD